VDRRVAIIQEDPHKERTDRIVTRWLKRHPHRLGAAVNLDQLDSLVEDKAMLAENLENLVKKERMEGRQEGRQEANRETARNLIKLAVLSDQQIAEATGLTVVDVQRLRAAGGSV
jgi:predicted transposase/invertase (TIGR01784 family)